MLDTTSAMRQRQNLKVQRGGESERTAARRGLAADQQDFLTRKKNWTPLNGQKQPNRLGRLLVVIYNQLVFHHIFLH